MHLDSLTGTVIGTCAIAATGGAQTWATKTCDVTGATETHDLFFKFTGSGTGELFKFNWWKFTPKDPLLDAGPDAGAAGTGGVGGGAGGSSGSVGGSSGSGGSRLAPAEASVVPVAEAVRVVGRWQRGARPEVAALLVSVARRAAAVLARAVPRFPMEGRAEPEAKLPTAALVLAQGEPPQRVVARQPAEARALAALSPLAAGAAAAVKAFPVAAMVLCPSLCCCLRDSSADDLPRSCTFSGALARKVTFGSASMRASPGRHRARASGWQLHRSGGMSGDHIW
jgi:hypothetical protein